MDHRKQSEYIHWSKTRRAARYDLATSAVAAFPLADLHAAPLQLHGPNSYGYAPLVHAIAETYAVDPDCVVTAGGCSGANHLAMATLLAPGDEVLVEHPVYDPLPNVARYLGASVKFFDRTEESGYAVDPEAVRRAITPRTRLIVITNLHNPSSAITPQATLLQLADIARSIHAKVLVDEVYLDCVYDDPPGTSFHLGPDFIVTSSLTKIYGLAGLKCGWIFAEADLARRMRRLDDLFDGSRVHVAEQLAVAAFARLPEIRNRGRAILEADRRALQTAPSIPAVPTPWGTTALLPAPGAHFADLLLNEYDTVVAPGHFFGAPAHFRIGMGANSANFAEGLRRIGMALSGDQIH